MSAWAAPVPPNPPPEAPAPPDTPDMLAPCAGVPWGCAWSSVGLAVLDGGSADFTGVAVALGLAGVLFGTGVFFGVGFLLRSGIGIAFSSFGTGGRLAFAGSAGAAGGGEAAAGPPGSDTRSTMYTGVIGGRGSSRGTPNARMRPNTCRPSDRTTVVPQGLAGAASSPGSNRPIISSCSGRPAGARTG